MSQPPSTAGSWEFAVHRQGERVRIAVTAATEGGEPVTLVLEVTREDARRIAGVIEAAAGDAFRRGG